MAYKVFSFILLSLCVSTISITITKTRIFLPLRHWAHKQGWWLGTLLSCPYCLSHWVSGFFVILVNVFNPVIGITNILWIDTVILIFATVSLVTVVNWVMCSSLARCESK